jgi:hypothetical protein
MFVARKPIVPRRAAPAPVPRRPRPLPVGRLPTLSQLDAILAAPAIPTSSVEDPALNAAALALTRERGRCTFLDRESRALVVEVHGGAVRVEVRTDRGFHTTPSLVPNVYVQVYRRDRTGFHEVARRSSGRGLLEGGDLRPALAERFFYAVARRRPRR